MNTKERLDFIKTILEDKKAEDIVIADAPGDLLVDKFVVCSGASSTHIKTLYDVLRKELRDNDIELVSTTGYDSKASGWMILDIGDVVVHIFIKEKREFYNLERLWEEYIMEKNNG
ncbi:MAG: ribosome silencing factor [Candidatus Muirbacterium halophilum]|nr:ribosome silencing factor [Candidatus Muirbacterium halophilum]